jgi:hypothetical protein
VSELPTRVWENISRARLAEDADIALKFTCECGWIIHAIVDDITRPVDSYLPPGWRGTALDTIQCPDCAPSDDMREPTA